jgi:hypothetical protein
MTWLAGIVACGAFCAGVAQAADKPEGPTGFRAYRVAIFDKPPADPLRTEVARGLLVFADRIVRFNEVPERLRDEFLSRYREIFFSSEVEPTGCFTLTHLSSEHASIGVLAPYGLVGWQAGPDATVTGRLYQSPDSVYDLTITETGDRLDGVGKGTLGLRGGATLVEYFTGARVPLAGLADCFREALELREKNRMSPK